MLRKCSSLIAFQGASCFARVCEGLQTRSPALIAMWRGAKVAIIAPVTTCVAQHAGSSSSRKGDTQCCALFIRVARADAACRCSRRDGFAAALPTLTDWFRGSLPRRGEKGPARTLSDRTRSRSWTEAHPTSANACMATSTPMRARLRVTVASGGSQPRSACGPSDSQTSQGRVCTCSPGIVQQNN